LIESEIELVQTAPNVTGPVGNDWPVVGGNLGNTRYSQLDQINTTNVTGLKAAWMLHLGSGLSTGTPPYTLEATPIVQDGVMYMATGADDVYALDPKTGAIIWEYRSGLDQAINTACCGWDNRGVAVAGVAMDRQRGEQPAPAVLDRRRQRERDVRAGARGDVGRQAARDPHRVGGVGDALVRRRPVDVQPVGLERQDVGQRAVAQVDVAAPDHLGQADAVAARPELRPNASVPSSCTAKFRLLLSTRGNG